MIDGRTYYRPLRLRKGQEALLSARIAQVDAAIAAAHYGLPAPDMTPAPLFSEYAKKYLKRKERNATVDHDTQRIDIVKRLWPDLPLGEYERSHIEELERELFQFKETRKTGLRPATVNRYMELLRNLFNEAIEDKFVKENPLKNYVPFAEGGTRRALAGDEIRAVVQAAGRLRALKRFGPIREAFEDLVLFGLYTGLRLSSILKLQRDQIIDGVVAIPVTSMKSKRRGNIKQKFHVEPLSPEALAVVARQPDRGDGYVFPIKRRHPDAVGYAMRFIQKETGIPKVTFHYLRHTVSSALSKGSGLRAAQVIMGHEDIRTTLRYSHAEIEEMRSAVTKLGTEISEAISKPQINNTDRDTS